jgi:hypothetical protein
VEEPESGDGEAVEQAEAAHAAHKESMYREKLKFSAGGALHRKLCREYLRGLA